MDIESYKAVKVLRIVGGMIVSLVMFAFSVLSIIETVGEGEVDGFIALPVLAFLLGILLVADVISAFSGRFSEKLERFEKKRFPFTIFEIVLLLAAFPVSAAGLFLTLIPALGCLTAFILQKTPDQFGSVEGILIVGIPLILTIFAMLDIMYMIWRKGKCVKARRE